MRNPTALRREFLKKWIKGLQICMRSSTSCRQKNMFMTLLDRQKAIKLSADVAMASTRNGTTRWSHAVIAQATENNDDCKKQIVVDHIQGRPHPEYKNMNMTKKAALKVSVMQRKILTKTSCNRYRQCRESKKQRVPNCRVIAKRLVQKKTRVLRSLVPGGESMNEISLISETLDYIMCLQTQVDVMRRLSSVLSAAPSLNAPDIRHA